VICSLTLFGADCLAVVAATLMVTYGVGLAWRGLGVFARPSGLSVPLDLAVLCGAIIIYLGMGVLQRANSVVDVPITLAVGSVGGNPGALGWICRTLGFLLLGGLIAIGPVLVLKPSLLNAVDTVVGATLSKDQTGSYDERSAADAPALNTVGQTYGLGVGWGSYRSSSLLPGLLANAGVFGVATSRELFERLQREQPGIYPPGQIRTLSLPDEFSPKVPVENSPL